MAKDGRTEKATPKKRQDARKKGDVAKSKEMGYFFSLLSFSVFMMAFGEWFVREIITLISYSFELMLMETDPLLYIRLLAVKASGIFIPVALLGYAFIMVNYFIQVRFLIAWETIVPDLKKLNPKKYFQNTFSRRTIVDLVKSFLILLILGYVVYFVFRGEIYQITNAILLPWELSIGLLWDIFKSVLIKVLIALLIISSLDLVYQKWEYEEKLKMKREDVKQDNKAQYGNPEVKLKQRQKMLTLLEKKAVQKLQEATFVTTNPTHYAVAVRYRPDEGNPVVVVKGIDNIALFIKEAAGKFDVPVVENPMLARELYNRVVEKEMVPEDLWQAVADILQKLLLEKEISFED